MDKHLSSIRRTRARLISTCKILSIFFFICLLLYCIAIAAIFIYIVAPPAGFSYIGPPSLLDLSPLILSTVAGGFTIFLLWRLFREIGGGGSPFTMMRVRQIQALGTLFLIAAMCNLLITPNGDVGVISGDAHMLLNSDPSASDSATVDVTSFMTAIVCFALSLVFKYGAALECEADDLV